ncbi:MAG: hypothetical protein ACLRZH_15300 [Ruthenibacterium lactatiformans]
MARKRCVLRWGAAVGLYWAACAAHVWRTGGLLALGLAWNMLLAAAAVLPALPGGAAFGRDVRRSLCCGCCFA